MQTATTDVKRKPLTDRDVRLLAELQAFDCDHPDKWARAGDVGGHDNSYHSHVLRKLSARRFVKVMKMRPGNGRGSNRYRITVFGAAFLAQREARQHG